MTSLLLFLALLPLISAATPPQETTLTPHQVTQVDAALALLRSANSTLTQLLEDPVVDNCPFSNNSEVLFQSLWSQFQEIDWASLETRQEDPTPPKTVVELIEEWEYPVEEHEIETEDGYLLTAHRIPNGREDCGPTDRVKRVAFLQHGLFGDSSNWIITGPEDRGLAFLLADNCFDVWMGNYRGNTHSRKHVTLDPDSTDAEERKKFYTFSFHELGVFDLAASVDYVLNATGASKIHYVGHSMGSTAMLVLLSEKPEYNDVLEELSAIGPASEISHMRALIKFIACPAPRDFIIDFLTQGGYFELLPINSTLPFAGLCKDPRGRDLCALVMYLAGGWSPDQMDFDNLGAITEHSPAGSSHGTIIHYAQTYERSAFTKYDHGTERNEELYRQSSPPEYDLSKVTVPVGLFWADNDLLADKRDVAKLRAKLPNVALDFRVKHSLFNHLDFVFAKDQKTLLYDPLLQFIRREPGDENVDTPSASPAPLLPLLPLLPLALLPPILRLALN